MPGVHKNKTIAFRPEEWERIIIEEKAPLSKKDLAVSGRDLIEAGVSPGPGLGKMLDRLLEYVLDDPEKNNREQLIRYINMNKNEEGD